MREVLVDYKKEKMTFDKKAQGGPGLGTIVTIIVVVFVGVLILLAVSGFFGDIIGGRKTLPSALSAKAEVCKSVSQNQVAFCEPTKLDLKGMPRGADSYVNCRYTGNQAFVLEVMEAGDNLPTCETAEADLCNLFPEEDWDTIYFNGNSCQSVANLG